MKHDIFTLKAVAASAKQNGGGGANKLNRIVNATAYD